MVLLTTTPEILHAVSLLASDSPLRTAATPTNNTKTKDRQDEGGEEEEEEEEEESERREVEKGTTSTTLTLPTSLATPISHTALIALSRALKRKTTSSTIHHHQTSTGNGNGNDTGRTTLNFLTRGTKPYTSPAAAAAAARPQPSRSYLELKARLLREQERREYNALVRNNNNNNNNSAKASLGPFQNSPPQQHQQEEDAEDESDISPSLVLNILLSVLLCAFSVFYASARLTKPLPLPFSSSSNNNNNNKTNDGTRVLLSLFSAVVVGVAESVIYAAYLRKVRQARTRERRRRETKEVIGREEITAKLESRGGGGDEKGQKGEETGGDDAQDATAATDVIWGRGVNGGVRRRVRERWEKEAVVSD